MSETLTPESRNAYIFMSDWEFGTGIIGLAELYERWKILDWLYLEDKGMSDPRGASTEAEEVPREPQAPIQTGADATGGAKDQQDPSPPMKLIPRGLRHRWSFTLGDDDFYPSVPHGHLNDKTNPWPKLNPYGGRAFAEKDVEDKKLRLLRWEMVLLWNDEGFLGHARKQIEWYHVEHPRYPFPVTHKFRLPRWR